MSYIFTDQLIHLPAWTWDTFPSCRASCRECTESCRVSEQSSTGRESPSSICRSGSEAAGTLQEIFPEWRWINLHIRDQGRCSKGSGVYRQSGAVLTACQCSWREVTCYPSGNNNSQPVHRGRASGSGNQTKYDPSFYRYWKYWWYHSVSGWGI